MMMSVDGLCVTYGVGFEVWMDRLDGMMGGGGSLIEVQVSSKA